MLRHLAKVIQGRFILVVLMCCFFQTHFLFADIARAKETTYSELPLKEMRVAAYTKDFAVRFGLPDPAPGTEPSGGLEAIEFAIEKGRFAPYYYCNFYLYVNSALHIKYPEEGIAGEKYMLIKGTHFFGRTQEQWMRWRKNDRLHLNNRQGGYHRKANLASMNYVSGKQGAITDLYYREFHKNILPGLAYLKLDCSPPAMMIKETRKNVGIWLQKESKSDYRSRIHVDPDDFFKFEIPDHVFQKIREWGLMAKEASDKIDQIRRKEAQQEAGQ